MKITPIKLIITFAFIMILLSTLLPGCGGGAPSLPVKVSLSFSEPPILNKPIKITVGFTLASQFLDGAQNVTAQIILPEGFEKVAGDLIWNGNLAPGMTTVALTISGSRNGATSQDSKPRSTQMKNNGHRSDAHYFVLNSCIHSFQIMI